MYKQKIQKMYGELPFAACMTDGIYHQGFEPPLGGIFCIQQMFFRHHFLVNHLILCRWKDVFLSPLFGESFDIVQVKRYIDVYSASSVIGFSSEDILRIRDLYAQAEESWSHTVKNLLLDKNESCDTMLPFKRQIDSYFNFLASVAELARSKWTEFDLKMMGVGLCIMLITLVIQFLGIKRLNKICGVYFPSLGDSQTSFGLIFSIFIVMIRACSFLSNSYICKFWTFF